ncbi:calcineurin-like phosphoesterase [Formosimonas limnophila]|uniref:Calcineurin-like phosphoesterase n=1 Tax=Formosimonas limnophila TaxID=1384487 RepID=A0A8J3CNX4_9BURK|nr:metallophosphoesterase [Formosimonas limnophila]GHA77887.1 calcineurin-like phosphoesterase [Formosimonas limnophila]
MAAWFIILKARWLESALSYEGTLAFHPRSAVMMYFYPNLVLIMNLFPIIVTSLLILLAAYIGWRLVPSRGFVGWRVLAWLSIVALAACVPFGFILRGSNSVWLPSVNYGFGLYSLLLVFVFLRDALLLGTKFWPKSQSASLERREFLRGASRVGAVGAAAAVFGYGAARAAASPTVVHMDVLVKNLPDSLIGTTIVQLSDVHIGQLAGEATYVQRIVTTVNELNADILALTGDFVDGSVARLRENFAPLGQLKAKYGAFFATGNHEYYSGVAEWMEEFRTLGWDVLENEHRVLNINGSPLVLAGVHDYKSGSRSKTHRCDPAAALANAPADTPRILLAHHPDTALLTDGLNVDLQLSGHTHAGQYFPATWIVHWVHQYAQGLNRRGDMNIYVNSGTGYWGPPIRTTDITGEITLVTLKKA